MIHSAKEGAAMSDYGDGFEGGADRIEASLGSVEAAVERVEKAINDKWSTFQWVVIIVIGTWMWSFPGRVWHSKWRYTWEYDIPEGAVYVQDEPHDCAFLSAPLGEKYCHYERSVSITRWATSTTGNPISSYDDGKTWNIFDPPAGETAPKLSTVKGVVINWEKKED
jgi:hypothetical protein